MVSENGSTIWAVPRGRYEPRCASQVSKLDYNHALLKTTAHRRTQWECYYEWGCAAFSEPGVLRVFEEEIFNLRNPACVNSFKTLTDSELGGKSTAQLRYSQDEGVDEGCLVFEGHFSSEVPPDAPKNVRRLGQASFAFKVLPSEHYLFSLWKIDFPLRAGCSVAEHHVTSMCVCGGLHAIQDRHGLPESIGHHRPPVQEKEAHYLYLGDYERQVASTIKCRIKGDGRIYGMYMKTDSYFEGVGMNELWQAHIRTRYARELNTVAVPSQWPSMQCAPVVPADRLLS